MKFDYINNESFSIFIRNSFFKNYNIKDKKKLEEIIKKVILYIKKNYDINFNGFYNVNIFYNSIIGFNIFFDLLDRYVSFNDINLKINIIDDANVFFKTDDFFLICEYKNIFYKDDFYYINVSNIKKYNYLYEFGTFIFNFDLDNSFIKIK